METQLENEKNLKICDYFEKITYVLPTSDIDPKWVLEIYKKNKSKKIFNKEFVNYSDNQLYLLAETGLHSIDLSFSFLKFINNHLWPIYCFRFIFKDKKSREIEGYRIFLPTSFPETDLFFSKPIKIILFRNNYIVSHTEINFPLINKDVWQLIDSSPPKQYIGDLIAAKYFVESKMYDDIKDSIEENKLRFNWAHRLEYEASIAINKYPDAKREEEFPEAKVAYSHTIAKEFFKDEQNIFKKVYSFYANIFWQKNDKEINNPIEELKKVAIEIPKNISDFPIIHLEIISDLMRLAWFSSMGTAQGNEITSINDDGDRKKIVLKNQLNEKCYDHFWDRIIFDFPFNYDLLLGSGNCLANIKNFFMNIPSYQGDYEEGDKYIHDILDEAMYLKQWTIPYKAYVQINIGNIKAIKFIELGTSVACIFLDQESHVYPIWFHPKEHNFKFIYPPYHSIYLSYFDQYYNNKYGVPDQQNIDATDGLNIIEDSDPNVDIDVEEYLNTKCLGLEILLASIIRDFWVVEERESVFGSSIRSPRVPMLKSDLNKKIVVYIPRIKYVKDLQESHKELNLIARRSHFVVGHLRKAVHASEAQIFLAKKYNIVVPEGFTFVRPHKRGEEAQERIYRSRSALKCINALDIFENKYSKDDWFNYERNVKGWLLKNGYVVDHIAASRNGDGGVDIQASKGEEFLLIQCKYWHDRKVGPNIIRELIGTLQTFPKGSRGVVITSTEITPKAKELAIENKIQFIERVSFSEDISVTV
ncbi:MAG: restriction endonuclease [bacterium]|nr:restriction endonuclease [bacterium]